MVDRIPSLENEKVYDRDAVDAIRLSDLQQLWKAVGSRVADVGNGAHHESTAEDYDTLVESTDPDPCRGTRSLLSGWGMVSRQRFRATTTMSKQFSPLTVDFPLPGTTFPVTTIVSISIP
jgi:hypothetical protein